MRLFAHIRKALWSCGCFLCHSLNTILAIIALGLVGLLLLNVSQRDIPLPDKFAHWAVNQVAPGNFEASWTKAYVDLRGGLLLSGFKLRDASTDQVIGTAREAQIKLSALHLLTRALSPLKSLEARGVEIYLPVSHSPSGLNEAVLFIRNISLHEDDGELIVSSLMVRSGGVHLHLTGSAPIHLLYSDAPAGAGPQLFPSLKILRLLTQNQTALANVRWRLLPSRQHLFSVDAHIPSLQLPQAKMEHLHATGELLLSKNAGTLTHLQVSGGLVAPENLPEIPLLGTLSAEHPIPFHLSLSGPRMEMDWFRVPGNLQLNLQMSDSGLPLDLLLLATDLAQPMAPVSWVLTAPGSFASGVAFPLGEGSIISQPKQPLEIGFRAYLKPLAIEDFLPDREPHRILVGARTEFTRINGLFNTRDRSLRGAFLTDELFIGNTTFAHVYSRLHWAGDELAFRHIHVRKDRDEFAEGSYFHNLSSWKFSLNARGKAVPPSLDGLLGKWWIGIFPHIRAPLAIPADVTVWGSWKDRYSIQSMTYAEARKAFYRNVPVPRLDIRVRSNRHWAILEELGARFREGSIDGTIAIQLGIDPSTAHRALLIDFDSSAPWDVVCQASGIEQLRFLDFKAGNPFASARGILWRDSGKGHNGAPSAELDLNLTQLDGTCTVKALELSSLNLHGHIDQHELTIQSIAGQFAEGVFTGNLRLYDWDRPDSLRKQYAFQLFDAKYGPAIHQFAGLLENPEKVRQHLLKDSGEGRLDLEFNLVDGFGDNSATGNGSVTLRQAKLNRIHLFGGLSKVLDSMGLGFSSSNLTAFSLQWQLADETLQIDRGLVTSPMLSLSMKGSVDMETKQLAMLADLTLFQGVISKVLSPVSENMQFDLSGTIDQPQWRMRINPLRWLQNRITVNPPNPTL